MSITVSKRRRDFLELEPSICDLDCMIRILFELCDERINISGDIKLSEDESDLIYHQLCTVMDASRHLKSSYYGEVAP